MAKLSAYTNSLHKQALMHHERKDWKQAVVAWTELVNLIGGDASFNPDFRAILYHNKGVAHNHTGATDRALSDFDTALTINPAFGAAYIDRGKLLYGQKKYDRAIADYNKVLETEPNNSIALLNRGDAYRGKGKFDSALQDYNQSLELDHRNILAYRGRGHTHFDMRNYDLAIADFDVALQLDPIDLLSIHYRAVAIELKQSRKEQAEIRKQYHDQLEAQQKKFDEAIDKAVNAYTIELLRIEEYKERQDEYEDKAKKTDTSIEFWMKFLKWCTAVVLPAVVCGLVAGIVYILKQETPEIGILWLIIPVITTIGFCSVPFFWHIRTLKQERARLMALSQDAYTKGILANLVNVNLDSEVRKEMQFKFFDHHAQSGSAKLIIDLENNTNSDGNLNVIIQHLKDLLPGGK